MNGDYLFYYDESGHSRSITKNTITASNYDDYFVACIIGIHKSKKTTIEKDYLEFEAKYKEIYEVDELKSTILKDKKYRYGFNSFKNDDIKFINEFLDICIKNDIYLYISVSNKIEYLVNQLLKDYKNSVMFDMDALRYSVTKSISLYWPDKVMDAIYKKDQSFSKELCLFLQESIKKGKGKKHKELEIAAFKEAIDIIECNNTNIVFSWNYDSVFAGFKKYLIEQGIDASSIIIDEEGKGTTCESAKKMGFVDSFDANSKSVFGIRMSDILCGIINGFFKSFMTFSRCKGDNKNSAKKLIDKKWFLIDDTRFECYKKMKYLIVDQHESWDKTFCTNYSDAFMFLICICNYFDGSSIEHIVDNGDNNPEYFNTYMCCCLEDRYRLLRNKLPIEPADIKNGFFLNQRGGKEYIDARKRTKLVLQEGERRTFMVLSVGIFHITNTPTMTIDDNGIIKTVDLDSSLFEWAFNLIALASFGEKILPSEVTFYRYNSIYFADIK